MRAYVSRHFLVVTVSGMLAACPTSSTPSEDPPDPGPQADAAILDASSRVDAGQRPDASIRDAGAPDSAVRDASTPDTGTPDATSPDSGPADAAVVEADGGALDAGAEDSGVVTPDASVPLDAAVPDATPAPDAATDVPDAATPDAAVADVDAGAPPDAAQPPTEVIGLSVTPKARLMTGIGQTEVFLLQASSADGPVPPDSVPVEWVSTNPAVASIAPHPTIPGAVIVTSESDVGSAIIVARTTGDPALRSEPVLITVAELETGVTTLSDDDIVFPRLSSSLLLEERNPLDSPHIVVDPDETVHVGPFLLSELQAVTSWEQGGTVFPYDELVVAESADAGTAEPPDAGAEEPVDGGGYEDLPFLGGSLDGDGNYVRPGNVVTTLVEPDLGYMTTPVVVLGSGLPVGSMFVGNGLQPVAGRVTAVVERDGYALMTVAPLEPEALFKRLQIEMDIAALRDDGLLDEQYERSLNGGPLPVRSGPVKCELKGGPQLLSSKTTIDVEAVPVFDIIFKTGSSWTDVRHLKLVMGRKMTHTWKAGLKAGLAGKAELECKGQPFGIEVTGPLPGILGTVGSYYVGRPEPFVAFTVNVSAAEAELSGSIELKRNVVLGFEYQEGMGVQNLSDFGFDVDPELNAECQLLGQPCLGVTSITPARLKLGLELEGGVQVSAGIAPSALVKAFVRLLSFKWGLKEDNIPRLKAIEGKAGLALELKGPFPYVAAVDNLDETPDISAALVLEVKANLDWGPKLLKRIGINAPSASFTYEIPLGAPLKGPRAQDVDFTRASGEVFIVREAGDDWWPGVVVRNGETVRLDVAFLDEPRRVPAFGMLQFLSPFGLNLVAALLDHGAFAKVYLEPAYEPRNGGSALLMDLPYSVAPLNSTRLDWTVPDSFCRDADGNPTAEWVTAHIASVWDPLFLQIGSSYAGSLDIACQVVRGRVASCRPDVPAQLTVDIVGDCDFRTSVTSDADGSFVMLAGGIPDDCTTLHLEYVGQSDTFITPDVPIDPYEPDVDLGTLMVREVHTSVIGRTVDPDGLPVAGATVTWGEEVTISSPDGTFNFPLDWGVCPLRVTAELNGNFGVSAPVEGVPEDITDVEDIRMSREALYFIRAPDPTTEPAYLYTSWPDGSDATQLWDVPGAIPGWLYNIGMPRDASRMAYTCVRPGDGVYDPWHLCIMDVASGNVSVVTKPATKERLWYYYPTYAPDGNLLYVIYNQDQQSYTIVEATAQGSTLSSRTTSELGVSGTRGPWVGVSPDGTYMSLVGTVQTNPPYRVHIFERATGTLLSTEIIVANWDIGAHAWKPDGSMLVVATASGMVAFDVSSGILQNQRQIHDEDPWSDPYARWRFPSYSLDGRVLAWTRDFKMRISVEDGAVFPGLDDTYGIGSPVFAEAQP